MARWGYRGLDATDTKHLPTTNIARATRASPVPAYDARAYSAHWRKAKMSMRISSKYLN